VELLDWRWVRTSSSGVALVKKTAGVVPVLKVEAVLSVAISLLDVVIVCLSKAVLVEFGPLHVEGSNWLVTCIGVSRQQQTTQSPAWLRTISIDPHALQFLGVLVDSRIIPGLTTSVAPVASKRVLRPIWPGLHNQLEIHSGEETKLWSVTCRCQVRNTDSVVVGREKAVHWLLSSSLPDLDIPIIATVDVARIVVGSNEVRVVIELTDVRCVSSSVAQALSAVECNVNPDLARGPIIGGNVAL